MNNDTTSKLTEHANKHPHSGDTYLNILKYFFPELVTTFLLYSAINLIDSYFIASLPNSCAYATSYVTSTLFHLLTKVAEAVSIGMVIICGQYNGVGQFKTVGKSVSDAFWITMFLGGTIALTLYFGAYIIYGFYGLPAEMVALGVPYLRLKALGIFLNFIVFGLLGFLRGVKNTKAPMGIFIIGSIVFVICDYLFIFGKCGIPCCGFNGSAIASIFQYISMLIAALVYILTNTEYKKYNISIFSAINFNTIKELIKLSWPVLFDKSSLAISGIWLAKMIANVDKASGSVGLLSSLALTREMEKLAFLPGLALASVITFLVSNDYRAHNWQGIRNNIKKILFLAFAMVSTSLLLLSFKGKLFIALFDKKGLFTGFVSSVMPIVSIFVLMDLLQLILSAALRGAADVKTVMWIRVCITIFYFFPVSYFMTLVNVENIKFKFILVYGALHLGAGLMALLYIKRFKGDQWKKQNI